SGVPWQHAEVAPPDAVVDELRRLGVGDGDLVGLAVATTGAGLAAAGHTFAVDAHDAPAVVRAVEDELRPRWAWWTNDTASTLIAGGIRVARCWALSAVPTL